MDAPTKAGKHGTSTIACATKAGKHGSLNIACAHSQQYTKDSVF